MSSSTITVSGKRLTLSNLEKVLYPSGFTKAQVLDYYAKIAPAILPHLKGRALSFKRFPNGTGAPFFFQKNRPDHAPPWIKSVKITGSSETVDFVLINDLQSLMWAANSAALELHVPLARAKTFNRPDKMVFDLDPGPGTTILDCATLALKLHDRLKSLGLESFAKTSGSKGIHVMVPFNTATTFDKTREFARLVALGLEQEDPEHVTSTMAKKVRTARVFIDWQQNLTHKTTVCAYSLRGTASPGVSTPVAWAELKQAVQRGKPEALIFTPEQVIKRFESKGDLFAESLTLKQKLPSTKQLESPTALSRDAERSASGNATRSRNGRKRTADPLSAYHSKRNFSSTPEPEGKVERQPSRPKHDLFFCVQKHRASHLHYDFRLEHKGVLLSWAVPKGPSLDPADKRLAMQVEDHPLEYGDFEGVIPEGYGAGVVMLWDKGSWTPEVDDVDAALAKGDLKFSLDGVKLKGSWVLVRIKGRDDRQWLLIKHRDEWSGDVDIVEAAPLSIKSFGDFADIEKGKATWKAHRAKKKRALA